MKMLDANFILRFLLNDNAEISNIARDIIKNYPVKVASEVIAEVIYVMKSVYKIEKTDMCNSLIKFMSIGNIISDDKKVIIKSIQLYNENNLDFVDCLLCAYHIEYGYDICTFDK